jgi:hypothetical protein
LFVFFGDPQLVFVEFLDLFLHLDLLVKQFPLVLVLQLADPLLMGVCEMHDGLFLGNDDFLLLLDALLQLMYLFMRV